MKVIELSQRKQALVDDEDFDRVSQLNWTYHRRFNTEYAIANVWVGNRRTTVELQRFILHTPKGLKVDHGDGDGLNCQKYNLRPATMAQNQRNAVRGIKNKNGFKGVCKHGNWWEAQINTDFGRVKLGCVDLEEAVNVYNALCLEFHGEFATPNTNSKTLCQ